LAPTRSTPPRTTRRTSAARPGPAAATPRRTPGPGLRRRKPEPQSNAKKVLGAVGSALPGIIEKAGRPAKKAKPTSRKRGAGLALALGGAGFAAMKQRGKRDTHVVAPASPSVNPAQPVGATGNGTAGQGPAGTGTSDTAM
jgi:hypothetical protein